jgi:5-methylthioadenosine/S-adenosylhomocysteine deaminase
MTITKNILGSGTTLFNRLRSGKCEYLVEGGAERAALNFLLGGVTTIIVSPYRPTQAG